VGEPVKILYQGIIELREIFLEYLFGVIILCFDQDICAENGDGPPAAKDHDPKGLKKKKGGLIHNGMVLNVNLTDIRVAVFKAAFIFCRCVAEINVGPQAQ
jgi:hypothetical protein